MKVLHPPWLVTAAGQTPQPSVSWSKDTTARVLGGGEFNAEGWKNANQLHRQSWIPCHHLGLLNQCKGLHYPQASRGWQPAWRGIHCPWLLSRHPWNPCNQKWWWNLWWLWCALATLFKMRSWESPTWIWLLPPWGEWSSRVPTWWPNLPDPP